MKQIQNPYISRVKIKNFRNFLDTDVALGHKQVIIGENNVGKTNFIKALQLILDKDFSDNDRQLSIEDFHDSIDKPEEKGEEIEITIEVQGYEHNKKLVAQFSDAAISHVPPTLEFKYRYFPNRDHDGNILNYKYEITKGGHDDRKFTSEDRSFINIHVIKALRDVERELKASKNSPLYKLVKTYEISPDELQEISDALKDAASGIVELDEIVHIKNSITDRFSSLTGLQTDNDITLRTFDIDTERLLYSLQVYMGFKERPLSELSLGLTNILYISLMLLLLKDKTILNIIKPELFAELLKEDTTGILKIMYSESKKGNLILCPGNGDIEALYTFMDEYNYRHQSFTILVVEEPEAHLHPALQRIIYREVLHNSSTSVIFTSHSTYITSVAPLRSIVHVKKENSSSKVFSTINVKLDEAEEKDIERYVDAKRGEIYFGKGIILCEGITEEYVVPASAEVLGNRLDNYGIIICNINSTNFKPYIQLLNALNITWILFTDGDYYEKEITADLSTGKNVTKRIYHIMPTGRDKFYRGHENVITIFTDLGIIKDTDVPDDHGAQYDFLKEHGAFIGDFTFEVDMMKNATKEGIELIKKVFNDLKAGGKRMQENFDKAIDTKDYWDVVNKIESYISKGRFAQRLSSEYNEDLIPDYIEEGISAIIEKVKNAHE